MAIKQFTPAGIPEVEMQASTLKILWTLIKLTAVTQQTPKTGFV